MASYRIEWKQSAQKELRQLPKDVLTRVIQAVAALADNPMPPSSRKLSGAEKIYRLRIGDYRVIYFVHAYVLVIEIVRVRHRRDVYRKLL
ncbi:MAG: type II toxin-antitoxin system RelE/ParE family toxin [Gammaproteobacteria bacterium]|nr:type II toxin-antitoxin system RelE/ParE family toxin [Gammaproteobacteria bacterium]MCI0590038.1 type II toxin-antitoxin system RelE/ParE family toxin [Gammaproteobacteria bacterium]